MEQLSFAIAEVEGPLDLILQLISKHKLDILDIDISKLLIQYMNKMEEFGHQNMDISSEFLEMASHLVYIKSVSLLPKHEEFEQLKKELTGQLIEYSICKHVAAELGKLFVGYSIYQTPPCEIPLDMTYRGNHNISELIAAYYAVAGKNARRMPPPTTSFEPLVTKRVVSVSSKITLILSRLYKCKSLRFHSLFDENNSRSDIVASFLAVLELVKSKHGRLDEDDHEDINLIKL
ncbi:MAG: segregation/condensation protein A [Oscillospiraceae bacterium]